MSAKKAKNRQKQTSKAYVTDINSSLSIFLLYEAANTPSLVSWARKELKRQEPDDPKIFWDSIPQKNKKFVCSAKPSSFRNMLTIAQATKDMGEEFFDLYTSYAPEYKNKSISEVYHTQQEDLHLYRWGMNCRPLKQYWSRIHP